MILVIPISYIFLKIGFPPEFALIVALVFTVFVQLARILFVKRLIAFSVLQYVRHVVVPTLIIFVIAPLLPLTLHIIYEGTYVRMFLTIIMSVISTTIVTYIFGLNKREKADYTEKVKRWFYIKLRSIGLNTNK
jgi:hypothetical protein